jgi:hypothetical protein
MAAKKNTDSYYEEQSLKAIDHSLAEAKARGLSPEETRFHIRRNFPFGTGSTGRRSGRAYKVWNRLVLKVERDLGLTPRKHKTKNGISITTEAGTEMQETATLEETRVHPRHSATMLKENLKLVEVQPKVLSAWQKFLQENPKPLTLELANLFLRKHTDWIIKPKIDHDHMRVVVKGDDARGCKTKFEFNHEFQTNDPIEEERAHIEIACDAWEAWIALEKGKY